MVDPNRNDVLGNVLTRADANENLTETFTYDALNRQGRTAACPSHTGGGEATKIALAGCP